MKKKFISFVLIVLLALSSLFLVSCNNNTTETIEIQIFSRDEKYDITSIDTGNGNRQDRVVGNILYGIAFTAPEDLYWLDITMDGGKTGLQCCINTKFPYKQNDIQKGQTIFISISAKSEFNSYGPISENQDSKSIQHGKEQMNSYVKQATLTVHYITVSHEIDIFNIMQEDILQDGVMNENYENTEQYKKMITHKNFGLY
ncbi:MAG: hypothetical protein RSA24_03550 [Clostridia bacterium]